MTNIAPEKYRPWILKKRQGWIRWVFIFELLFSGAVSQAESRWPLLSNIAIKLISVFALLKIVNLRLVKELQLLHWVSLFIKLVFTYITQILMLKLNMIISVFTWPTSRQDAMEVVRWLCTHVQTKEACFIANSSGKGVGNWRISPPSLHPAALSQICVWVTSPVKQVTATSAEPIAGATGHHVTTE